MEVLICIARACEKSVLERCPFIDDAAIAFENSRPHSCPRVDVILADNQSKVLNGLSKVEQSIQELTRAYTTHSNNILGKISDSPLELFNLAGPILDVNTLFTGQSDLQRPNQLAELSAGKRKKKQFDPNAPKRPVTPYFLYMLTERGKIAKDLEDGHSAKAVADEGTKRWNEMPPEEKEVCGQ